MVDGQSCMLPCIRGRDCGGWQAGGSLSLASMLSPRVCSIWRQRHAAQTSSSASMSSGDMAKGRPISRRMDEPVAEVGLELGDGAVGAMADVDAVTGADQHGVVVTLHGAGPSGVRFHLDPAARQRAVRIGQQQVRHAGPQALGLEPQATDGALLVGAGQKCAVRYHQQQRPPPVQVGKLDDSALLGGLDVSGHGCVRGRNRRPEPPDDLGSFRQ